MHSSHGDVHKVGLQDACLRCAEQALHPLRELDADMIRDLVTVADPTNLEQLFAGNYTATHLEAVAQIKNAMEQAGKLFEVAPIEMMNYLRARWHIPIALMEVIES